MAMNITGQVALITGAAGGLGRCFAKTLLDRGAKVCLADIDVDEGKATESTLQADHGTDKVVFVKCDVTKDEDFKNSWKTAADMLGPVSLLINNAGIGNEVNWQLTLNINVGGCIRGTMLALEQFKEGGNGGVIVNVASIAGLKVVPFGPVYAATKHAIVGLTRSLGHDFHYKSTNVKVQSLCPSFVRTDLIVNSKDTPFSQECSDQLAKMAKGLPDMQAEDVAKGLVKLLEEGRNGGCLVVEFEKAPYYVDPPLA